METLSLSPKVGIRNPVKYEVYAVTNSGIQEQENKVSPVNDVNQSFAAASQPSESSRANRLMFSAFQCLPDGRGLFRFHKHSLPLFTQVSTGNSTGNKEQFA
jgi:hypothetical protein